MLDTRTLTPKLLLLSLVLPGCGGGSGENLDPCPTAAKLTGTYRVGPGQTYETLQDVASKLKPGDVVDVEGNQTYPGNVRISANGTAENKIIIRGVRIDGKRPVLSGGTNTIEVQGNHVVLEGFEVTGGTSRCIFHHSHDLTVRDTLVRDCPAHGILSADNDSGSLTLDHVEVTRSGEGDRRHPIYATSDQVAHPGAVFRMQHCWLHDQNGGNGVKTRAERNEIYYNWIEGSTYHELELIGPDPESGTDEDLKREDSDVVGNVLIKRTSGYAVRIGGDGTGDTGGRYRFVNNTIILAPGKTAAIRVFDRVESLELHNNVFFRAGGGAVAVLREAEASWISGRVVGGRNNWVPEGSTDMDGLTDTIIGSDPGFTDLAQNDLRPREGAAIVDRGVTPESPSAHPFPSPLGAPTASPPPRMVTPVDQIIARPTVGAIDLGAYEHGTASTPVPGTPDQPAPGGVGSGGGGC